MFYTAYTDDGDHILCDLQFFIIKLFHAGFTFGHCLYYLVGSFAVGILILGEQANVLRIAAAAMIIGGLLLMKLSAQS